eukprot:scaffold1569_cov266-Pinguiococcus_pyrenoidosus.AAC.2
MHCVLPVVLAAAFFAGALGQSSPSTRSSSIAALLELVNEGWDPYAVEAALQRCNGNLDNAREALETFEEHQRQLWIDDLASKMEHLGWPREDANATLTMLTYLDVAAAMGITEEQLLATATTYAKMWETDQMVALLALVAQNILSRCTDDVFHLLPRFAQEKMGKVGDFFQCSRPPKAVDGCLLLQAHTTQGDREYRSEKYVEENILFVLRDSYAVLSFLFDATLGVHAPAAQGHILLAWSKALAPLFVDGLYKRITNEHVVSPKLSRHPARTQMRDMKYLEGSEMAFAFGQALDLIMEGNVSMLSGRVDLSRLIEYEMGTEDDAIDNEQQTGIGDDGEEDVFGLTSQEVFRVYIFDLLKAQQDSMEDLFLSVLKGFGKGAQKRSSFLYLSSSPEQLKRLVYYALRLCFDIDDAFSSAMHEIFRDMRLPLEYTQTLFAPHRFLDDLFLVGTADAIDGNLALQRAFADRLKEGDAVWWAMTGLNGAQFADMSRASDSFGVEVDEILASIESLRSGLRYESLAQRVALARARLQQMKRRKAPRGQASQAVDEANFIGNLYCTPSGRNRRGMAFLAEIAKEKHETERRQAAEARASGQDL